MLRYYIHGGICSRFNKVCYLSLRVNYFFYPVFFMFFFVIDKFIMFLGYLVIPVDHKNNQNAILNDEETQFPMNALRALVSGSF